MDTTNRKPLRPKRTAQELIDHVERSVAYTRAEMEAGGAPSDAVIGVAEHACRVCAKILNQGYDYTPEDAERASRECVRKGLGDHPDANGPLFTPKEKH